MNERSTADRTRHEWLLQEAQNHGPIVLNARISHRWLVLKSRFHGVNRENGLLFIEDPSQQGRGRSEFEIGQNVGISFRHRHKKCIFETQIIDESLPDKEGTSSVPIISLRWPDRIHEFQRRLYSRAKVPPRLTIPVDICPENNRPIQTTGGMAYRGLMLDLSAGGMNIALPAEKHTHLKAGDTVTCTFALEPGQAPQEISGWLRHCEQVPGGHLRVGLQFLGLEASTEGYKTLRRLGQAANRFRQMQTRRRSRRL